VQPHMDNQAGRSMVEDSDAEMGDGGASEIANEQECRPNEEIRMLYVGFATGVAVGIVFPLYIIAATAHMLP